MRIDLSDADRLMREAVAQGTFPGGVLLVAQQGEMLMHRAYGMADLFSGRPMTRETIFDLASLTKPLATGLAAMFLVQRGRLELDRPCGVYWPQLTGAGKGCITLRHLLSHCSGLPAWRPYYLALSGLPLDCRSDALRHAVLEEPLQGLPGERVAYSDLGFMVLQWIVEHTVERPLHRFLESDIYPFLSAGPLFFMENGRPLRGHAFAATELCPLRGRLIIGEVHDDNAHALGGIAGHAGLFGTAEAVWGVLQTMLASERGDAPHPLFDRDVLQHFFQRQKDSAWALGFDTPAERGSSAGLYFSSGSVGHLGYTGTSFWMDRVRKTIVVLLTNRVHPSRYNERLKAFRPQLHDAVMGALTDGGKVR